jgi:hypothetical protein
LAQFIMQAGPSRPHRHGVSESVLLLSSQRSF